MNQITLDYDTSSNVYAAIMRGMEGNTFGGETRQEFEERQKTKKNGRAAPFFSSQDHVIAAVKRGITMPDWGDIYASAREGTIFDGQKLPDYHIPKKVMSARPLDTDNLQLTYFSGCVFLDYADK